MFTEDPDGVIGYSRDPKTGEMFQVNIATGEGLDRHHEIRRAEIDEAAQAMESIVEDPDGTIDLERTRVSRSIKEIFSRMANLFSRS